jgi:hypothetical protein
VAGMRPSAQKLKSWAVTVFHADASKNLRF